MAMRLGDLPALAVSPHLTMIAQLPEADGSDTLFRMALAPGSAVSYPYAYVGGTPAITVTMTVLDTEGEVRTNVQTVTFDDPLPANSDELAVFSNDKTLFVTIEAVPFNEPPLIVLKVVKLAAGLSMVLLGRRGSPRLVVSVCAQRR